MLEMICFAVVAIALAAPGLIVPVMSYRVPGSLPITGQPREPQGQPVSQ